MINNDYPTRQSRVVQRLCNYIDQILFSSLLGVRDSLLCVY